MPLFKRIREHSLIHKISDNSLETSVFDFYIQQDSIFLAERAKAFAILASRAPSADLTEYLTNRAEESNDASQKIFQKYAIPLPSTIIMSPACRAYTQYMIDIAQNGSFLEGLAAQLPCSLMYQKLGEHVRQHATQPNKFEIWINSYSNPERRQKVETFIDIIDGLAEIESCETLDSMRRAFYTASKYEFDFWDDAFNLRES